MIDTNRASKLSIPKIIIMLNSGMLNLIKEKYGIRNPYSAGFEMIEKRKQDLQKLHILNEKLAAVRITGTNSFEFDLSKTTFPVLYLTRMQFSGTKESCCDQLLDGIPAETDDLNDLSRNLFKSSSFEWREVLYRVASDKIVADTDGTFSLSSSKFDFIRYPKAIDIAGYTKFDGSASSNVDCELPPALHSEVVDRAVFEFKLYLQDPNYQFAQVKAQEP